MISNNFEGKKQLVAELSEVLKKCSTSSIANIELKRYQHKTNGWYQEFVLLTWNNGAISTANNNANSLPATARNVTRMMDGGVYENLDLYKKIMNSDEWIEF